MVILNEAVPQELFAGVHGAYMQVGLDERVENAFNDGAETARFEYGQNSFVPSLATADVGKLTLQTELCSRARAIFLARRHLDRVVPGEVHAIPLALESAWKRRRVNFTTEDVKLSLPSTPQIIAPVSVQLEKGLLRLLEVPLEDGEVLEEADLRRVRQKYKVAAFSYDEPNESDFVATLVQTNKVIAEGQTLNAVKKDVLALSRAGAIDGIEEQVIEITERTRRSSGHGMVEVVREKIMQKASVRLTIASLKSPDKAHTAAWLFYGKI